MLDCTDKVAAAVWGEGPNDNVRCHILDRTEFSEKKTHDRGHGIGGEFDGRDASGVGSWGYGDPADSYKTQLDNHMIDYIAGCSASDEDDNGLCLLDCPPPRASQTMDVRVRSDFNIADANPQPIPAVGDVYTIDEAEDLAVHELYSEVQDRVGIYIDDDDSDYDCPLTSDSRHTMGVFLQYLGEDPDPAISDHLFALFYTLPDFAFGGNSADCMEADGTLNETKDTCEHRVIEVHEFSVDPTITGPEPPFTINLDTSGVGVQLVDNECYLDADDTDELLFGRDPNPLTLSVDVEVIIGGTTRIFIDSIDGEFGNCAWQRGQEWCAASWAPAGVLDIYDGAWLTGYQTLERGTWDWQTIHEGYSSYSDMNQEPNDFVTENGENYDPHPQSPECFYSRTIDPNGPKGAYDVEFIDMTAEGGKGFLIIDKSGSMDNADGTSGKTRLDNAKSAAKHYLKDTHEYVTNPNETLVALMNFSKNVNCFDSDADGCLMYDMEDDDFFDDSDPDYILDYFGDTLVAGGSTAILDALWEAAHQIVTRDDADGDPDQERFIYLITDGHENASTTITEDDQDDLVEYLQDNSIVVYATAVSEEADYFFLRSLADYTGGLVSYTEVADGIANVYHDMVTQSRDGATIIPLKEMVANGAPVVVTESSSETDFYVEEGAEELMVMLTSKGYASGVVPEEGVVWDLNIALTGPGGENIQKIDDTYPSQVTVYPNSMVTIRVDDPDPTSGWWHLAIEGSGVANLKANLTVTVLNPHARLYLDASPNVVTEDQAVIITPTITYDGTPLNVNKANCYGYVFKPGGGNPEPVALVFSNTRSGLGEKTPPTATFDDYIGRGNYRVEVTCEVPENTPAVAEGIDLDVPAFTYTATENFFVDSAVMPPCKGPVGDCDKDGVPDDQESSDDNDNDGLIGKYDTDSDNDDVGDFDDNCLLIPNNDQADMDNDDIGDACDTDSICVFGSEEVRIGDNADVEAHVGSNLYVEAGAYSLVTGTLSSGDQVFLREGAVVEGDVRAVGEVELQNEETVQINGDIIQLSHWDTYEVPVRKVVYGNQDVEVSPNSVYGCNHTLTPGAYANVMVRANCRIALNAGAYDVNALYITSDAELVINGAVEINADAEFHIGDRVLVTGLSSPDDLIVYTNQPYQVSVGAGASFLGHIVAPYAQVTVNPFATYEGCIHANQILIDANAHYSGGAYTGSTCGNGVLDPDEICDDGNYDNTDDCVSGCVLASCDDGFLHVGYESDVDCGVTCDACELGQACIDDTDCESLLCSGGICSEWGIPVSASIDVYSDWGAGYCANVAITNNGQTVTSSWTVVMDTNQSIVNNLWNGTYSHNGSIYTVESMSYNGAIYPGASQSFGFCADTTGSSYLPEIISASAE